jgi:hypothetical protein
VFTSDGRGPAAGEFIQTERIYGVEDVSGLQSDNVLVLDQSNAVADYAQRDEVVLRLRLGNHLEDLSRILVKRFDCRQYAAIGLKGTLAQNTFGAVLVDIEAEYLPTKLAVNENLAGANRWFRLEVFIVRLPEIKGLPERCSGGQKQRGETENKPRGLGRSGMRRKRRRDWIFAGTTLYGK